VALDDAQGELTRLQVDGVPTFLGERVEGGPPLHAALVFRVGRADETLAWSGLTHIVEHLAMFRVGRPAFEANAFVDDTRTTFFAAGEPAEVAGFLRTVSEALGDLPLERLEPERRILETESAGTAPGLASRLLGWRCGVRAHGLAAFPEFGLHTVTPEQVEAWARERFTRGNAALWLAGHVPDDLTVVLPDGGRMPVPDVVPLDRLTLPAYVEEGSGSVSFGALVPRTSAATMGFAIASDRLHERLRMDRALTYGIAGAYDPLTADLAHAVLVADCLDEHAAQVRDELLAVVDDLADEGASAHEIAAEQERYDRSEDDPGHVLRWLDSGVRDELLGRPLASRAQLREEFYAVDAAAIGNALRAVRESMIVIGPAGVPAGDERLAEWGDWDVSPVEGRAYRARRRNFGRTVIPDVVVGEAGVSLVPAAGATVTLRFEDCVAVVRSPGGELTLLSVDQSSITITPGALRAGDEVEAAIYAGIPPWKFVAEPGGRSEDSEAAPLRERPRAY
jgi:hypothetical protein